MAFSRGGGSHDRIADALWLTGLASSQPFVPDLPGHWRAAGHVAVLVPVDGPVTAVVESEELRPMAVADEVVVADDLIAGVAKLLAGGRVGVLGADAVPFAWWSALRGSVLEPADDLAAALRRTKSPAEQRLLRAAVYDVVISSGERSVTLGPHGGAAGAAGWTTGRLAAGDLLRIDAYGSVSGYLFDFARSIVVGRAASQEQLELIDALRESVAAGIAALRPGVALSEVARACGDALAASGHARRHGVPEHLMGGFWGHGLGLGFEPPWIGLDSTDIVEPGWCLAVERRAVVPGLGGAQYEDDVLIGPEGAELLTRI